MWQNRSGAAGPCGGSDQGVQRGNGGGRGEDEQDQDGRDEGSERFDRRSGGRRGKASGRVGKEDE